MKISKTIMLSLVVLFLSGCQALKPVKMANIKDYTLSSVSQYRSNTRSGKTLLVTLPTANPGFESQRMIYASTPYERSAYRLHQWIDPPAEMVLPLETESLRNSHFFSAVVSPPFAATTDYRLETRLITMQEELYKQPRSAHIALQVWIIDNNTQKIIASKRFDKQQPSGVNTPLASVVAMNHAAKNLMKEMVLFIESVL